MTDKTERATPECCEFEEYWKDLTKNIVKVEEWEMLHSKNAARKSGDVRELAHVCELAIARSYEKSRSKRNKSSNS